MQLSLGLKGFLATIFYASGARTCFSSWGNNAENTLHAVISVYNFFSSFTCIRDENVNSTVHKQRLKVWKRVTDLRKRKTVVYNLLNGDEQCETRPCWTRIWYYDVEAVMEREVRDLSYIFVMHTIHVNCNLASHPANSEPRNWHVSAPPNCVMMPTLCQSSCWGWWQHCCCYGLWSVMASCFCHSQPLVLPPRPGSSSSVPVIPTAFRALFYWTRRGRELGRMSATWWPLPLASGCCGRAPTTPMISSYNCRSVEINYDRVLRIMVILDFFLNL